MIDTNKYKGHTPAPWAYATGHIPPDARLITDAPLLLAEVKRLRRELSKTRHWVKDYFTDTNGDYKSAGDKISHYDFMQEMERIE